MKRRSRATLRFPPLEPHEALRIVHCLEEAVVAIWKVHGHKMSELLLDQFCDAHAEDSSLEAQPATKPITRGFPWDHI